MSFEFDDTLKISLNLDQDDEKKDIPKEFIKALRLHAHGTVNVVIEWHQFELRTQQGGESFDSFLTSLRDLAKSCNYFDKCKDLLLRDIIVVGLRDGDVIESAGQ